MSRSHDGNGLGSLLDALPRYARAIRNLVRTPGCLRLSGVLCASVSIGRDTPSKKSKELRKHSVSSCRPDWQLAAAGCVVFGVQRLVPNYQKSYEVNQDELFPRLDFCIDQGLVSSIFALCDA